MKPTLARSSSIVFDASTTRSECSSTSSARPAPRAAITSRGRRLAITNATPKITAEYSSVAVAPIVFCRMPAGTTATAPTSPEISPSFEFASTSSASVRTTVGTSALFEIAYVFCATIAMNARGNSSRLSALKAIAADSTTRTTVMIWITRRRPPAMRSIAGPMSGATNRNGTKLIPRNMSTRPRAASASRLNSTESARATAIAASPAAIEACVRASRPKRDVAPVGRDPRSGAGRRELTRASYDVTCPVG